MTIPEPRVRELLTMRGLIPAIEQALIDFSAGRIRQPLRTIVPVPEHNGWFGAMPAVCGDHMGAKLVTFYPANAGSSLPTHMAVIHLFSASTGEPLAAIDGRLITEMRTAAVSAVAARRLSRPDARVLAILGSGVQAQSHLEALRMVRGFEEIRVWSRNSEHARAFAARNGVQFAESVEQAVRGADAIVTVTSAAEPILHAGWVGPDAYINAVGAVGAARRELAADLFRHSAVVVESREAAEREAGDIILSGAKVDAEIGELLADPSRAVAPGRVIFKSLGIAVEDIAAAALVYRRHIAS